MVLLAATETNLSRVIPCDEVDVHPAWRMCTAAVHDRGRHGTYKVLYLHADHDLLPWMNQPDLHVSSECWVWRTCTASVHVHPSFSALDVFSQMVWRKKELCHSTAKYLASLSLEKLRCTIVHCTQLVFFTSAYNAQATVCKSLLAQTILWVWCVLLSYSTCSVLLAAAW